MRGNPGKIYQDDHGTLYIARHADQDAEKTAAGKIYVLYHKPANTLFPELNEEMGKTAKMLREVKGLHFVGYID